jgi:hypothetical protein
VEFGRLAGAQNVVSIRATLPNCKQKARDNQGVVLIASERLKASLNSKKEKNVKNEEVYQSLWIR